MGLIGWVILGAVAGWLASMITGRNSRMGCLANIFIGILGAIIGGFLVNLIGGEGAITFSLKGLFISVLGAVVLLLITGLFKRRS
ncbi:MAG: GlsB/YeaQ/YmgE family stress response membrane protein [Anaerolineaceae bacterium]|jgi:uncharacterized membrane protein YeaQ/YmgE (transglycosylase-associated protein family)